MQRVLAGLALTLLCLSFSKPCLAQPASPSVSSNNPARYETRAEHDRDGIGKFYQGREIAHVMGHQAADWLERPERDQEERPDLLLAALHLKPGDAVADIGAGTGFYTRRMAKLVGNKGLIYAVEIQQEMLDLLTNKMAELNIRNVKPVLGTITDPRLPPAHEFDYPHEMVEAICKALKPAGRVVLVEFRGEDPEVPIKPLHKMTDAQVRKEMAAHPLQWMETSEILPRQHIIVFKKTPQPR